MLKLTERTLLLGFLANLYKDEPKWGDDAAKVRKWTFEGSKSQPKGAKSEPIGAKRSPKGCQREPKGSQRGAKGSQREPKGAKREPKGDQNASKSRPSEKVAKNMKKGRCTRVLPDHSGFSVKNR